MLGRPTIASRDGVTVAESDGVASIVATVDLVGLSTGRFATPSCGLVWSRTAWPDDIEFLGFAFTQFALPVVAGADLGFDFRPAPGLRSPRAVSPLIARSGNRVTMVAPIDHFHEQIVAVTADAVIAGWHGDLDTVPAGFATRWGIYEGESVSDVLRAWRDDLAIDPELARPRANPLSTHLSYWTDNGAAYWYRTEPGRTIGESVVDAVRGLRDGGVPVRAVELDSWFYSHATPRPITEIGYPEEVPPIGAVDWTARPDAFPRSDGDPISRLAADLDGAPLVLHARHVAPESPDVDDGWWVDEFAAHPRDPGFFRRWFDDAVRWGASVIEQDWMLMYWFGVRELRAAPGRAETWQRVLNQHARDTGIDLLWCMSTPADMMLAASLDRVIAVRTCDDYRFASDPALLWTWFLTVNRLADALGLVPFKDCFFSTADVGDDDDVIDGDRHAAVEAVLAALSGGPVGLGDRLGRTDRELVMRACDDDGRLRRVDRPVAAIDRCLFGGPARGEGLMWATTTATDGEGDVWTYVLAINTADDSRTIVDRFDIGRRAAVYDWRMRSDSSTADLAVELGARDWALFVVSPPGVGSAAAVGDVSKYLVVESVAVD